MNLRSKNKEEMAREIPKDVGLHVEELQDKTQTLSGDSNTRSEGELQIVVTLQSEVIALIIVR